MTFRQHVEDCRRRHRDRYRYRKPLELESWDLPYSAQSKIEIRCPDHGWFRQALGSHKQGHGCGECGPGAQKSFRERVKLFRSKHGRKYEYKLPKHLTSEDSLLRARERIEILCRQHGCGIRPQDRYIRFIAGMNSTDKRRLVGRSKTENWRSSTCGSGVHKNRKPANRVVASQTQAWVPVPPKRF